MTRFFLKTALLLGLLTATALGCWYVANRQETNTTNGWAAIVNKHRPRPTPAPILWLVGGSNVMFGYDSDQLTAGLRQPVYNLGIGAALGLPFMLNEVRDVAKPGDTVLLSLEYDLREGSYNVQLQAADFYPPARAYIHYPNPMTWLRAQAQYRLRKARAGINSLLYGWSTPPPNPTVADTVNVYFENAFSNRGDLLSHLNNPQPPQPDFAAPLIFSPYRAYIDQVNAFVADQNRRGVRVFFTYPPLSQTAYLANKPIYRRWQHELATYLKAPILTNPDSTVYADSLCFDTIYHLNRPGRTRHTGQVLAALGQKLN